MSICEECNRINEENLQKRLQVETERAEHIRQIGNRIKELRKIITARKRAASGLDEYKKELVFVKSLKDKVRKPYSQNPSTSKQLQLTKTSKELAELQEKYDKEMADYNEVTDKQNKEIKRLEKLIAPREIANDELKQAEKELSQKQMAKSYSVQQTPHHYTQYRRCPNKKCDNYYYPAGDDDWDDDYY